MSLETYLFQLMYQLNESHNPKGLSYLAQFLVGSKLNFHKFKHDFRDIINPMCISNDGIEDTEHFLLLCLSFDIERRDHLTGILALRPISSQRNFPSGRNFRQQKLLSRSYLLNFRVTFSPRNKRNSARSENCTDWKSAFSTTILTQ